VLVLCSLFRESASFHSRPTFFSPRTTSTSRLFSSVGDGKGPPPPSNDDNKGDWGDYLDPARQESENLKRAREYMSENSLPINYNVPKEEEKINKADTEQAEKPSDSSSALVPAPQTFLDGNFTSDVLLKNPYMAVVARLSPSELINKFTATADPRVQDAVRSTVLGLLGGLPKMAFETTTITTGQKLASLMFQLQMTGYM
jgi:hypothetical protein